MTARKQIKEKSSKKRIQASKANLQASKSKTSVKPKSRLKRPSPELAELLRLVNLSPKDANLPKNLALGPIPNAADLIEGIQTLPIDLMAHLLEVFEREAGRELYLGSVRLGPTIETELRVSKVVYHYDEIRTARAGLYRLINTEPLALYRMFRAGGPLITVNSDHKIEIQLDMFGSAVQGVDVRYLRECPKCARIFFAGRIYENSRFGAGCSKECNKKLRNDRWIKKYREGDYQGARLTDKEKAAQERRNGKR